MEELAALQENVVQEIQNLWKNYKKDSATRKNEDYFIKKITRLNNLWQNIEETNKQIIRKFAATHEDHEYFTLKYFAQAEVMINQYLAELQKEKQIQQQQAISIKENRPIDKDHSSRQTIQTSVIQNQYIMSKKLETKKRTIMCNLDNIKSQKGGNKSKAYLTQKIKLLSEYWTSFATLYEDVVSATTSEDVGEIFEEFTTLEEQCQEVIIQLQEQLDSINQEPNIELRKLDIRLPRLEIPHFYGEVNKWVAFHDIFNKLINQNQGLSNTHKINYLKAHTGGAAAKLINHLPCTEENYEAAWKILTTRYNNKRLLVSTQLNTLFGQASLTAESAKGIKTLHDTVNETMHAINNQGINTESWDPIIVHLMAKKLDNETIRLYEASLTNSKELQPLEKFLEFLEGRFSSLEAIQNQRTNRNIDQKNTGTKLYPVKSMHITNTTIKCKICEKNHFISECSQFRKMAIAARMQAITKMNLCQKCFSSKHGVMDCKSKIKCNLCKGIHNTLLHQSMQPISSDINTSQQQKEASKLHEASSLHIHSNDTLKTTPSRSNVLLGTALVKVTTNNGREELLRIIIDTGSQATFITEEAVQKLRVRGKPVYTQIAGIGGISSGLARSKVNVTIKPRFSSTFYMDIEALVFKQLTKNLPDTRINPWKWNHINNLMWADPNYSETGPIDILLGADYYSDIILNEVIKGKKGEPVAQRTELGWVIFGATNAEVCTNNVNTLITSVEIDKQLQKFWELEEIQTDKEITEEERECDDIFIKNYKRNSDGSYEVRIPFKQQQGLGDSKRRATARLLQIERRLANDTELHKEYHAFMAEYLKLKHMKEVPQIDTSQEHAAYYLPHHAVIKEGSTTSKVRVVFDASAKSSTGVSLNDLMHTGRRLQQNLDTILMRWRTHQFVFTADIEKMYRQIKIAAEDQPYQRILWRFGKGPIKEFQLTTVTYGTASAPYLAVRTLQQLAHDEQTRYPRAAKIALADFYVDDLMSGADSINEAKQLQMELTKLLKSGGFNLRKWMSNSETVLENIPEASRAFRSLHIKLEDTVKALGIHWNPANDTFEFKVNLPAPTTTITKRRLLSEASKLFDPLGLLAPTIIQAKIMLQQLWLAKVSWDEAIPTELDRKWKEYAKDLRTLETLRIPRWINHTKSNKIELHGFCDASEQAYAACVYVRSTALDGKVTTTMITAKTKVAPIKTKLTLPRLELCGAELVAKLLHQVEEKLQLQKVTKYAWCDSTIVLAWIKGSQHKYRTFVANRISTIQTLTQSTTWNHVKSNDNPADCASRGITPSQLCTHSLWWTGPEWLKLTHDKWPIDSHLIPINNDSELKKFSGTASIVSNPFSKIIERSSNINKLQRIIAYANRFINNTRKIDKETSPTITPLELKKAVTHIVLMVQAAEFQQEISQLKKGQQLSRTSKLLSLNPFLDGDGVLRVGGRLQNSTLSYEEKHPVILPHAHPVTNMIINEAHLRTMHGGVQLTLAYIRKQFWITNGRNCVRFIIQKCIRCQRFSAQLSKQLMGSLPQARVTPTRPFVKSGVDYAGPLQIRTTKGRGHKSYKGYLAIFVCLVTKAIHIEIVSDQTTQAFIAAYKRFTARRGLCSDIYSDNGTNFVGANNELIRDHKKSTKECNKNIIESLAKDGTRWHFIPPAAPHFGGIWEAGVKSVKYHLKRVIGETKLTFEELATVTCEIEACLNSRPLSPITNDPTDLSVLTPGHFLIGDALIAPPQPGIHDNTSTGLTRWKLVEKIKQDIWKRWSQDYLSNLQQRTKWSTTSENINRGALVLIKDDNLPPSKWLMGRVTDVHPGLDGKVRVVTIQCSGKTLIKRPITKLVPLQIAETIEDMPLNTVPKIPTATVNLSRTIELPVQTIQDDVKTNKRILDTSIEENKRIKMDDHVQSIDQTSTARQWMRGHHTEKVRALADQLKHKLPKANKKGITIRPYCGSKALLYVTTILGILLLPTPTQGIQSFEIKKFETPPGLYFDHTGNVNFVTHNWNIIIYYNLTFFWEELNKFRHCVKHMKTICEATTRAGLSDEICSVFLKQLQAHLSNIEVANELIKHSNKDSHRIVKRGIFNGVGYVANELFGVLDQRSAEKYENDIEHLKQNERHLLELMKNQTSITDGSIKLFKANHEALQNQMALFSNHLKQLEDYLNTSNKITAQQNITDSVLIITLHATLIMIRYHQTQNVLIEMITHTHHGKIHPSLLTPAQLRAELNIIKTHLPQSTTIPEMPNGRLIHLYNILTIQMRLTDNNVIFCVTLPLQDTERFQIFRLVPVPIIQQNKSIIIQPSSDYLLVNAHRDRFYPMKQSELRTCIHVYDRQYLCKPHHVIYSAKSNESKCELDFLNHKVDPLVSCTFQVESTKSRWIKLSQPNSWIFVIPYESMIDIICEGVITPTKLRGNGIVYLQPSCSITHDGMLITTQDTQSHGISMSFLPTLQLNNSVSVNLYNLESPPILEFNFSNQWTDLQQTIDQHKHKLKLVTSMNSHDFHHYISIYAVLILIIISGALIIRYKFISQPSNNNPAESRSPQPEPTHNSPSSINDNRFIIQNMEQLV